MTSTIEIPTGTAPQIAHRRAVEALARARSRVANLEERGGNVGPLVAARDAVEVAVAAEKRARAALLPAGWAGSRFSPLGEARRVHDEASKRFSDLNGQLNVTRRELGEAQALLNASADSMTSRDRVEVEAMALTGRLERLTGQLQVAAKERDRAKASLDELVRRLMRARRACLEAQTPEQAERFAAEAWRIHGRAGEGAPGGGWDVFDGHGGAAR